MAENEGGDRFYMKPNKPIDEMTEDELDAFADEFAKRIKAMAAKAVRERDEKKREGGNA